MAVDGYFKVHRKLLENKLWLVEKFTKGQAWLDLIGLARYSPGYMKIKNGELINLSRGECGYSVLGLSKRWKWSRPKVERFLSLLESEKMIQQKIASNHTIIKILNYDFYQNVTTDVQQTLQQTCTKEERKERDKEKKENSLFEDLKNPPTQNNISSKEITDLFNLYNSIAVRLPKAQKLSKQRINKIKARLKDLSINEWKNVFKKAEASDFCCGINKSNWKADLDWLIKNDNNYLKVLEGKFDNNKSENSGWEL